MIRQRILDYNRYALAVGLVLLGVTKLLGGHDDSFLIPKAAFYISALLELAMAVMLLTKYRALGALGIMLFTIVGSMITVLEPLKPCGCFGRLPIGQAGRLVIAWYFGIGAGLLLLSMDSWIQRRPSIRTSP